jgi:acetylornithine deacetylase/succinyl-diaminopimelate desuccinylase-like protein
MKEFQMDDTLPPIDPSVQKVYDALLRNELVKKALAALKADDARAFEEQKTITRIPSPPFHEERRAAYLAKRFRELGLDDASIDKEGNAFGWRRGRSGASKPVLVICAHLDSVFPEETDLTIVEDDDKVVAPGIGDDARGLTTLLSTLKAFHETGLETVGDILFLGSVGEEELGDLRGVKALFRERSDIDGFLAIDGTDISRIVHAATGSRRYHVNFKGPGGHSFAAFGTPSAVHAMGRAVAKIADLVTPSSPKTTFTVGTVHGGRTINAIASDAQIGVDMRSNDTQELGRLEKQVLALIDEAVAEENRRWSSDVITVELKPVGDRPAGQQARDALIVQSSITALRSVGVPDIHLAASSTDSNVPISLGVPSVTIGVGGEGGGSHTLKEWYRNKDAYLASQTALLMALSLVGLRGVTEPLLVKRGQA